jgi:predicted ATPase/signal transduction histidine kinase
MITVPGYQILERIYESSSSLVFRGRRKHDDLPVVLKMLKKDYPTSKEILGYKQEYRVTCTLESLPGVIGVYGLDSYEHTLVMILEDFGGESLNILRSYKEFDCAELLRISIMITRSLGEIHRTDVIHKDINPSNIVYNPFSGELKIIDFGISSVLTTETPVIKNPGLLEGTLAYISPEQTGRMNKPVDYRTDYYSLGATLYEMFTGSLPFDTVDPLEMVHCHLAMQPTAPSKLNEKTPETISNIVMKLLEKDPEDRYQSTAGIRADLEECLKQYERSAQIKPFPLGAADVPERFHVPRKLYGRQAEIETLMRAFDRVVEGHKQMMLVSGHPGVGKSSLIKEIHKPITRQRGFFISGKFDQYQRNVPYAAVVYAVREMVRLLLTESETELSLWRKRLSSAMGTNGRIVTDVISEVELIVGPQPPVPDLPSEESQNRFNLVFLNFIRALCRKEQPLVLFLDDLQWADSSSLSLLEMMIADEDTRYLFLIGAYRNNEVDSAHPLAIMLTEFEKHSFVLNRVELAPLRLSQVLELTADTLHASKDSTQPLAELLTQKTGGNPFFINEFLKSIHEAGLLRFDLVTGSWQWDLQEIRSQKITDNVVDLLTDKIRRLGPESRRVLTLAACIGNQYDLEMLAVASELSQEQALAALKEPLKLGLIVPLGDAYRFVEMELPKPSDGLHAEFRFSHDRIQQAAYSLISPDERLQIHRSMGLLLLRNTRVLENEASQFAIVNHMNVAMDLLESRSERHELARLNLKVARKAKTSAAYGPAYRYLETSRKLLDEDSWQDQYDLTLDLFVESAEVAYLCTEFEEMERLTEVVLRHARTLLDKVQVYEVAIQALIARNKLLDAVKTALWVLRQLGMTFPRKPKKLDVILGLLKARLALAGKDVEGLVDLPKMRDPTTLAAMRILTSVGKAAYIAAPELVPLLAIRLVILSVRHGNAPESAFGYATYGLILTGAIGDIERGDRFGKLALRLSERFSTPRLRVRIVMVVNFFITHWKNHQRSLLKPMQEVYRMGLETGNLEDAALAAHMYCTSSYRTGRNLKGLEQEMNNFLSAVRVLKQESSLLLIQAYHQVVSALSGDEASIDCLSSDTSDEEKVLSMHRQAGDRSLICVLYYNKLVLCYLFEQYEKAAQYSDLTQAYLDGQTGTPAVPVAVFYDSLAQLAMYKTSGPSERKTILKRVASNQKKMKKWARHGPMNFLHKYFLVEAERLGSLGKDTRAAELYNRSIDLARENGFTNEEALATELAAKFYLSRGTTIVARAYMTEAHYCYQRWGASAKVKHLETEYGRLLTPRTGIPKAGTVRTMSTLVTTSEGSAEDLDLSAIMKASQTISREIVFRNLIEKLMIIIMRSAGAQRGFLIRNVGGELLIEAKLTQGNFFSLGTVPVEGSDEVSEAIINYVARTNESVVLNDSEHKAEFDPDEDFPESETKSILCAPLVHQGKQTAIIYLENDLASGVFTRDRLEVLGLLCSQAAISMEISRLYEEMEQRVVERTKDLERANQDLQSEVAQRQGTQEALQKAKAAAEHANRAKSEFLATMSHELRTPLNAVIGFSEMLEDKVFGELNELQLKYLSHVVSSGKHLLEIINDILDLAKVESGRMDLEYSKVHIRPMLEKSMVMIREKALKHQLGLELHMSEDLEETEVVADEIRLKQIVFNLLSNAAKFTPDGGAITLSALRDGSDLAITVSDTGIGIRREDHERVFNKFEQVHANSVRAQQGTGLGLALTRRLVELHHGRIWVRSDGEGKGSDFTFTIPMKPADSIHHG